MIKEIDPLCQQMVQLLDLDKLFQFMQINHLLEIHLILVFIILLEKNIIGAEKFFISTINGLNDEDVRLSKKNSKLK